MKKLLLTVLLLTITCNIASANGFFQFIKEIIDPVENFISIENKVYKNTCDNLEKNFVDLWNLKQIKNNDSQYAELLINIDTFKELFKPEDQAREDILSKFKNDKNNMQNNRELYDYALSMIEAYEGYEKLIDEIFKKEYQNYSDELYKKSNFIQTASNINSSVRIYNCQKYPKKCYVYPLVQDKVKIVENWQELKENTVQKNNTKVNDMLTIINENIKNIKNIADEIRNYSIQYEQTKLNNFYKSKYGNLQNCGIMANVIVSGYLPKNNCYYDTYTPLEVIQVLNGGVIAKDAFTGYNSDRIFVITSKDLVDGDTFYGRFLYKGIYKYTNVLGSPVTVRKYQEISIPKEKFYFIEK